MASAIESGAPPGGPSTGARARPGRRAARWPGGLVGPALLAVWAAAAPAQPAPNREIEARYYERAGDGVAERPVPPARPAGGPAVVPLLPVGDGAIASRLDGAGRARARGLGDAASASPAPRLVPEDLSRRARIAHITVGQFTDAGFARMLADVGALEGFTVVAHVAARSGWAAELRGVPNLQVSDTPGREYTWAEDFTEIGVDGSFSMTARVGDRRLLRRTLFVDRVRRFYPAVGPVELEALRALPEPPDGQPGELADAVMRSYSDIMFMNLGLVEADGGQDVAAALAASRGAALREAVTYLEGGNVLLGTSPEGEPYALVGRDSAAVSAAFLARYRGRPVTEAEVIAAMAGDLGVAPARLALVEQPWVFHLDMAISLLGPRTAVLNDALEAFRLHTGWLRDDLEAWRPRREAAASPERFEEDLAEWTEAARDLERTIARMWRYTERFARYEARALADLEAAGLTVLRLPGRFQHPTRPWDRDLMNFLNGEVGTGPGGRAYFITQGGDPRAERVVASRLLAPATGLDRVYVAPRLLSRDTLWEKGGLSCRVKMEGDVLPRALASPAPRP